MSNVVRMPSGRLPHSTLNEGAVRLEESALKLLEPLTDLPKCLQVLDRQLVNVRRIADVLNDSPETTALRKAVHPIRDQLSQATKTLVEEIERVGGFGRTRANREQ